MSVINYNFEFFVSSAIQNCVKYSEIFWFRTFQMYSPIHFYEVDFIKSMSTYLHRKLFHQLTKYAIKYFRTFTLVTVNQQFERTLFTF